MHTKLNLILKMKILALDTSSHVCSVALLNDGKITTRDTTITLKQAQIVLTEIQALLLSENISLNQLDAIAFGTGPGSFTGVRIAASITQGLAYALQLPVIPISSLQAIAYTAFLERQWKNLLVAVDARMDEMYWASYQIDDTGLPYITGEEMLLKPEDALLPKEFGWAGIGNGWEVYAARIPYEPQYLDSTKTPSAGALLRLAEVQFLKQNWVPPTQALPVYLRNNVAKKSS
jgi:tRNA threonylcarbamoyladenosine biosynthesis protein TsaB